MFFPEIPLSKFNINVLFPPALFSGNSLQLVINVNSANSIMCNKDKPFLYYKYKITLMNLKETSCFFLKYHKQI